jgi:hypothetical protein
MAIQNSSCSRIELNVSFPLYALEDFDRASLRAAINLKYVECELIHCF